MNMSARDLWLLLRSKTMYELKDEDIYKFDGSGRPITKKEAGLNRAQRRALKRKN